MANELQEAIETAVKEVVALEAMKIQDFWFNRYAQLEKELLRQQDAIKQLGAVNQASVTPAAEAQDNE